MAKKEERKLKAFMLDCIEAGVDEVGRGALCGPVVTAAVVLPKDFDNSLIKDSKKLNRKQLEEAYKIITKEALTWATCGINIESINDR
jgi:ribonuclease HII